MPSVPHVARWNVIRKLFSHLSGVDVGSTPVPIDFSEFQKLGVTPVIIGNDSKFPVHTMNQNIWYSGGTIGDSTNPDTNKTQTQIDLSSASATALTNASQPILRTNTAGKTFYLMYFSFQYTAAPSSAGELDFTDGQGGTKKLIWQIATSDTDRKIFVANQVPIKFSTSVAVNSGTGNNNILWTMIGWEE